MFLIAFFSTILLGTAAFAGTFTLAQYGEGTGPLPTVLAILLHAGALASAFWLGGLFLGC